MLMNDYSIGIQTMPSSLNLRDVLVERGHVSSSEAGKAYIFLFVGSIRPVKDPLYLVNTMAGIVCWDGIIVCLKNQYIVQLQNMDLNNK